MSAAIAELAEDRVVEGVYAVARKERRRTRGGAPYLALELVDPSGRIEARVWSDVELLDGRFGEGDAVRVLGRVERYRDRLQLDVRSVETADRTNLLWNTCHRCWFQEHRYLIEVNRYACRGCADRTLCKPI